MTPTVATSSPSREELLDTGPDTGSEAAALGACDRLVALHLDAVWARFGAPGLGVIDLPELGPEPIVAAQVQIGAVLYWCSEVEATGLLACLDALAQALATGAADLPVRDPAMLYAWWKGRHDRFASSERRALYGRLFDRTFQSSLEALARAFVDLGRRPRELGIGDLQARIGSVASEVGRHLSDRATGIAGFAARDILDQIRRALALLREPGLAGALGGGSPWAIVERWAPRLIEQAPAVHGHTARAEAGLTLLRWVGDHAAQLRAAASRITRRHPLVTHAETWIAAEVGGV